MSIHRQYPKNAGNPNMVKAVPRFRHGNQLSLAHIAFRSNRALIKPDRRMAEAATAHMKLDEDKPL